MPIFLDASKKRKKYFRAVVVIGAVAFFSCITFFIFNIFYGSETQPPVKYADTKEAYLYYYSAANKNKIALTFDDGPRATVTKKLMDVLERNQVPATFFFIGEKVLAEPHIVYEAASRGFTIGSHSFTHQHEVHNSRNRLALELHATGYVISKITGKTPLFYRPPFLLGIGIDPTVNPYIKTPEDMEWTLEDGYMPIGSDIDPRDWLATSSEAVLRGVLAATEKTPQGHIVLLHDERYTADALESTIISLKKMGYSLVSLETLLTPPHETVLENTLRIGDTDRTTVGEVSKLQWFLYQQGDLDPYLLTGTFGTETKRALTRFQLRHYLIDPSDVDPRRVGIADRATRDLIHTISTPAITAAASERETLWRKTEVALASTVRDAYINVFPALRMILTVMVWATLFLVILRCSIFGILIFYGWYRKKQMRPLEDEKHEVSFWQGVSVLIPAYNEEQNIRSTLESIIRSSYWKKEIIVIDDGSTDTTSAIVQSVIDTNPGESITLVRIENGGKARALNYAVSMAIYEICVVVDADAVLDHRALFYFSRHFFDSEVGAVAGKVRTTGSNKFLDLFQTLEYAIGQNIDKRAFSVLDAVGVVPGPAGAWRREHLKTAGGFHTDTLVEDQDMTLRLLRMGKKVVYEPRAIAYTETPHTVKNFLKQRFRWVYGTMQCFWKNKAVFVEQPLGALSLVVLPNIFIFNILLPLTYPFADSALIFGILLGDWQSLLLPFALFTVFDLAYTALGLIGEGDMWRVWGVVPLQRVIYRQLLYYTVAKSVVRAVEGVGSGWNKFVKIGETQRFYFSSAVQQHYSLQEMPEVVMTAFQGPSGSAFSSTNRHEVSALSVMPRQSHSAGEISSPAWAPNTFAGLFDEPNTYEKSSSPFGPTSSH